MEISKVAKRYMSIMLCLSFISLLCISLILSFGNVINNNRIAFASSNLTFNVFTKENSSHPVAVNVNPHTNKIYIANEFGMPALVDVIDGQNNKFIRTIFVGHNESNTSYGSMNLFPPNIAVNPQTNRVYITEGDGHKVFVIDGTTDNVVGNIELGNTSQQDFFISGIAINPQTNKIYVIDSIDTIYIIDANLDKVIKSIKLKSNNIAVNPQTNRIYVTNFENGTVSVIDGVTNNLIYTIDDIATGGITVDSKTNRIYITTTWGADVIDGGTNKKLDGINDWLLGHSNVASSLFNSKSNELYILNRSKSDDSYSVTALDETTNKPLRIIALGNITSSGAYNPSMAINAETGSSYITNYDRKSVSVIK